eukprot:TRINITY_DN4379_c0_g1_i2.p1 TRINITY_DN4379_c0_g1~~TRINITY_DN4379_c0_g1_i2.p1  ORF type:complete len:140 (-),score=1.87 TRINITY_DN4379_c0_g1_i2:148-567(-)
MKASVRPIQHPRFSAKVGPTPGEASPTGSGQHLVLNSTVFSLVSQPSEENRTSDTPKSPNVANSPRYDDAASHTTARSSRTTSLSVAESPRTALTLTAPSSNAGDPSLASAVRKVRSALLFARLSSASQLVYPGGGQLV